jgi:hypothetical protein
MPLFVLLFVLVLADIVEAEALNMTVQSTDGYMRQSCDLARFPNVSSQFRR